MTASDEVHPESGAASGVNGHLTTPQGGTGRWQMVSVAMATQRHNIGLNSTHHREITQSQHSLNTPPDRD